MSPGVAAAATLPLSLRARRRRNLPRCRQGTRWPAIGWSYPVTC